MSTKKRINRHREIAMSAMTANENARNDDWDLLFTALNLNGVSLNESQKFQIKQSGINYHSLLRQRQHLQRNGILLPTDPDILEKRRLLEKEFREYYSQN